MPLVIDAIGALVQDNLRLLVAIGLGILGLLVGHLVGRLSRHVLNAFGMDEMVEGTSFERTAQSLNTSTVALIGGMFTWFVIGAFVVIALQYLRVLQTDFLLMGVGSFVPRVFLAIIALLVGLIIADKSELLVAESIHGIKLPPIAIVPRLVRYTIIFLTLLVVLSQLGVATAALLILLAAYFLALIVGGAVAFRDLLASGAAGTYLLLEQPFGIGDEVVIGDRQGVVQEIDAFVTHIEDDGHEYLVPNRVIFQEGVARVRND
jgi:small-conductance mechanosensitive channel